MNTNYSSSDETNSHKDQISSSWLSNIAELISTVTLFIMSFLSRLFGLSQKKDSSFKNQEASDLREETDTAPVSDKVATPSPKAALLRTAGKHTVATDDAHDDKNQIEITVEQKATQPAASKPETTLPGALTTEGSSITKVASEPSTGLPEPATDESKNTLVIKNLPFKFTKPELDQLLINHQAKAKNVRMLRDTSGRFTGIAFIRCPSKEEAGRLINAMNNLDIAGRGIQVEFKKKKKKTKKEPGMAPSATSMQQPPLSAMPPGYPAPMMVYPQMPQAYQPYPMPQESKRAFLTASAPAPRTSGLRTSGGFLVSSTSSVEDEEYLSHIPYNQRRRMSLASSTSSVDDEDYMPRSLHTSVDDVNHAYPHSRLSLSSSGGVSNPKFAMPSVRPVRQPRGPDQTNGFSGEYRKSRSTAAATQ